MRLADPHKNGLHHHVGGETIDHRTAGELARLRTEEEIEDRGITQSLMAGRRRGSCLLRVERHVHAAREQGIAADGDHLLETLKQRAVE